MDAQDITSRRLDGKQSFDYDPGLVPRGLQVATGCDERLPGRAVIKGHVDFNRRGDRACFAKWNSAAFADADASKRR